MPDEDVGPVERAVVGPQEPPQQVLAVPGGTLRLFPAKGGRASYIRAVCDSGHGDCDMSRTVKEAGKFKPGSILEAQGRPVGLLAAWLAEGRCAPCKSSEEHNDMNIYIYIYNKPARLKARRAPQANPEAKPLFDAERPKRDDEPDSEPEQECGSRKPPVHMPGS